MSPGSSAPGPSPAAQSRRGRRRKVLRSVASAALVAAIFGLALPHFASYRSVWASIEAMTWPHALLVAAVAAASMASYWFLICAVLPSVRLREAAAVNLGSSAVANTLPAGGALAMGVSWAMLSSWGVSTADNVLYTLVSGIWNVFARLGLPVLALLALLTIRRPDAVLTAAGATGLACLGAAPAAETTLPCAVGSRNWGSRVGPLAPTRLTMCFSAPWKTLASFRLGN